MGMTFSKDAHFLSWLGSFNSPHGVSPNLGSKAAAAAPFENNFQEDRKKVWKSRGESCSPRPFKREADVKKHRRWTKSSKLVEHLLVPLLAPLS